MLQKSCFLVYISDDKDVFHRHNCEDVHGIEAGFLDNVTLAEALRDWVNGVGHDGLVPNPLTFCDTCKPQLED